MALTDTACRNAKGKDKPYKMGDSLGLFLLVNPNGSRWWRLKYRLANKEKLLSLGVYPEISLSEARQRRDQARALLAQGLDPSITRKESKQTAILANANSFEAVARDWHAKSKGKWSADHATRILARLEKDIFPHIGSRSVSSLRTTDLLDPLRKVEERGAIDLAGRLRQHIDGVMRYAVQTSLIENNPARDMIGALAVRKATHRPALPLEAVYDLTCCLFCEDLSPLPLVEEGTCHVVGRMR